MTFKSWDNEREFTLLDCPFCGGSPVIQYKGNNHTKSRQIEIKCRECRVKRVDGARKFGFDFLEEAAVENWNKRV